MAVAPAITDEVLRLRRQSIQASGSCATRARSSRSIRSSSSAVYRLMNRQAMAGSPRCWHRRVRPRDLVGKTRKRVAAELVADLEKIYQRSRALDKEIKQLVAQTGSALMDLHGIGPSGAARLLIEVGDIGRFPDRNHFASWNGTAPLDASSGAQTRHRLSRAGNRQVNRTLHIMAVVQLRNATEGRAYFDRRVADGKTPMEAMRALKRRLSDIVYRTMVTDALVVGAGPGGHRDDDTDSSATGSQSHTGSSEQPLPEPAELIA